jgi:hypothetical protein
VKVGGSLCKYIPPGANGPLGVVDVCCFGALVFCGLWSMFLFRNSSSSHYMPVA